MAALPDTFVSRVAFADTEAEDRADRANFTVLYDRTAPRVYRFLCDLLRDRTLAHDATQETFARAFQHHRAILRDRERAVPWLFGIARNVSLELRKARARADRVMVPAHSSVEREGGPVTQSPERAALGREAMAVVDAALARLSEDRRAMLLLRMDHGLSYDEIATLMQFSLSKVKVEIHRAREILRATWDEYQQGTRERG